MKFCSYVSDVCIKTILGVTGIAVKLLFDTSNKYLLRVLIALAGFYCVWHIICKYSTILQSKML